MSSEMLDIGKKGVRDVLLTLFVHGETSQSQIYKRKTEKLSWSQVLKVVKTLQEAGLVEATRGKRNAKMCSLTTKGYFYLIIHEPDICDKVEVATRRAFQVIFPKFSSVIPTKESPLKDFLTEVFKQTVKETRKKINLDYFDPEYAQWVYGVHLAMNLCRQCRNDQASKIGKSALKCLPSLVSNSSITNEALSIVVGLRDSTEKQIRLFQNYKALLEKLIQILENPKALF